MSSSSTTTRVTPTRSGGDAGTIQQSAIYKGIMTPLIFVTFLLSLVWVDLRYTLKRSRYHSYQGGWMPCWLHNIVYRRSPYNYVRAKDQSTPSPRDEQGEWHYHSKQKKLMRMEVDDAFEMRGYVLVAMAVVSLSIAWGFWALSSWLWRSLGHRGLAYWNDA